MKFIHYIQPETLDEALAWAKKPNSVILGGMMWLRLQKRTVENAIDLSKLGLDCIEETDDGISVGAYVTLRQMETNPLLLSYTHQSAAVALSPIVGVQFRNTATVGGSVYGRFGFSDVSTLLTSLGASVRLQEKGIVPMEQFVREGASHDLLTHILLPKEIPAAVAVFAQRNTATDFPVLTSAVCRRGQQIRMTFSPAPIRGYTVEFSTDSYRTAEFADESVRNLSFHSDKAASAEYRTHLAKVFVRRALAVIGG